MAHEPRDNVVTRAVAALLLAGACSFPGLWAQTASDRDSQIRLFTSIITNIDNKASQATTEIELNAVADLVALEEIKARATIQSQATNAYDNFTTHKNKASEYEQRVRYLNAEIEKARAKTAALSSSSASEEKALEDAIAETRTEIAGFEGRQQRVPHLEAKLKAMPEAGFMDSAPREALRAELAEAQANLPSPAEVAKVANSRTALANYERELRSRRSNLPASSSSQLPQLEDDLKAAEQALQEARKDAEWWKKEFVRVRAQAYGVFELLDWLAVIIEGRRQALRLGTGVRNAVVQCATMQGPFRCTGAFDGSWQSYCVPRGGRGSEYNGPAKVTFGPDGWVEVRMTDASAKPGDQPTIVGGKISPDGKLLIERNKPGWKETYTGQFNLVTTALPSGAARPVGGGTYELVMTSDEDEPTTRCRGTMKLN